jgi:hypothetical protein
VNRKLPCDRLLSNGAQNNTKKITNIQDLTQNDIQKNMPEIKKNDVMELLDNNECYYCHKKFARKYCLERHMKSFCKVVRGENIKLQNIYDELQYLKNKNEGLESKINVLESQLMENHKGGDVINNNNTIINNNTTNNTINITIIGYGKEDMKRINPELRDVIMTLKKGWQSPIYLINKTHFNQKFPEYHNIYIPDIKNKFAMIHNGQNYLLKNTSDVINDLYDRHIDYIKEKFGEYGDKIPKSKKNALARLIKLVPLDENEQDKEKKEMKERLFENIKLLLFNKRNVPIKTRDKIAFMAKNN